MSHDGYDSVIHRFDLSLACAEMMTGRAIQNAKVAITGMTGEGKSVCGLSLAYGVACQLSLKKYGDIDHWMEFFDPDENIAVILQEDMLRLADSGKPGQVMFYDEIQEEISNSREYASKKNMAFNQLIRLKRPNRNAIITTVQEIFASDKQQRHLYNYYIEMSPMHAFEYGVNFCKIKIGSLKPLDMNKHINYPYPLLDGIQYPIAAVLLPPKKIMDACEKHREENMKISEERKLSEIKNDNKKEQAKVDRLVKKESRQTNELMIQDMLITNPMASVREICNTVGCSESTARYYKRKYNF
jgi:hypothetical protein